MHAAEYFQYFLEVSVMLSYLFVHEPLHQTTVVCCNSVFAVISLCIDHHSIFHIAVELAQAHPNLT